MEIAPWIGRTDTIVRANIIFHSDYVKALEFIKNNQALQTREKILCQVLLILIYRSGARVGEIYGLRIRDIILDIFDIVRIENNLFRTLKSNNAIRNIRLLLTYKEKCILKEWIGIREKDENGNTYDALFSDGRDSRKISKYSKHTSIVRDALRMVTGDLGVNIHSLRHSYANYNLIWMLRKDSKNNIWQINDWLEGTDGENKTHEKVMLNCDKRSRRSIYYLSQQMGHGSPETTVQNYMHCSDFLINEYVKYNTPTLADKEISMLTEIPQRDVPKYRKRNGDKKGEYHNLIALKIDKNRFTTVRKSEIPYSINYSHSTLIVDTNIPLKSISRIFQQINHRSLEDISLSEGMSVYALKKMIESGACIERNTGYDNYMLYGYGENNIDERKQLKVKIPRNNIDLSVIKNIEDMLYKKNRELIDLIKIWEQCYRAKYSGIYVTGPKEGRIFTGFLRTIGLRKNLRLIVTSSIKKLDKVKQKELLITWEKVTGIKNNIEKSIKDSGVCMQGENGSLYPVPGITVLNSSNKADTKSNFHYLHHAFFLCAVYIKWKDTIETGAPLSQN
jgi:integrase